jgi:tRNA A37 N6-isopentenylltransferase MiaA
MRNQKNTRKESQRRSLTGSVLVADAASIYSGLSILQGEPAPDQNSGWRGRTYDINILKSGDSVVLYEKKIKEVCIAAHGEAWGS